MRSVRIHFLFVTQFIAAAVLQQNLESTSSASISVDAHGRIKPLPVLRQQGEMPVVKEKAKTKCDYAVTSQMIRIAVSTYVWKPGNLEYHYDKLPKWLKWTGLNMTDCGWKLEDWECISPCNETNHDQIIIAYNEKGNEGGIKPKTCAFAFSGRDDEGETDEGPSNLYGFKDDYNKWKIAKETGDPKGILSDGFLKEEQSDVWNSWSLQNSGFTIVTTGYHKRDYENYKSADIWSKLQQMAKDGTCEYVIFTGHSNGGAAAQIAHADHAKPSRKPPSGELPASNPRLDALCWETVPCKAVIFSSTSPFVKNPPLFEDCDGNWFVSDTRDAAPTGTSTPPGPRPHDYDLVYGANLSRAVDVAKGYQRVWLQQKGFIPGKSKVKGEMKGCNAPVIKFGDLQKLQRQLWTVKIFEKLKKTGSNLQNLLIYNPWHFRGYMMFSIDAWNQGLHNNFWTHPGAAVFFVMSSFKLLQNVKKFDRDQTGTVTLSSQDLSLFRGVRMLADTVDEMFSIDGLLKDSDSDEDANEDNVTRVTKAKVLAVAGKLWTSLRELTSMDES